MDHGLLIRTSTFPAIIVAYFDADWVDCKDSCRSTMGYAVYFGPNLTSWHSKKQPTVSKSFTKAEYRALGYTVADTIWIQKLFSIWGLSLAILFISTATMLVLPTCLPIQFSMIVAIILLLIIILSESGLLMVISLCDISLPAGRLLIFSSKACPPTNFYFKSNMIVQPLDQIEGGSTV